MTSDLLFDSLYTVPLQYNAYINGDWHSSKSESLHSVINPATETILCQIQCADDSDVQSSVNAARDSFSDGQGVWASTSGSTRALTLRRMAEIIVEHKDILSQIESLNSGKPLKETEWDLDDVSGCFEYYATQAERLDTLQDTPVPTAWDETFECKMQYIPVGVVGAIIPWNYPLLMAAWKIAPALAAGCSVVIKPSELTPLSLMQLFDFWHKGDTGLPAGVLNLITGDGSTGALLTSHGGVDKISFTGSVPTGSKIMQSCAQRIRNVTLELGGKSPLIIFDDVPIDKAVEWAMFGCFWTNGQICSATSRVLVQSELYDQFKEKIIEETQKIPFIEPLHPDCLEATGAIGPVVSRGQYERVNHFIQTARDETGAEILTGGGRPDSKPTGFYIQPTIIEITDTNVTVWNEEIFGPVMSLIRFDSEEEAIEIANNNKFGLAGAVMTQSPEVCERVARKLRCGVVWKNCSQPGFIQLPWGGLKLSGIGRELGADGIFTYLEPKSVVEYTSPEPWAWYIK